MFKFHPQYSHCLYFDMPAQSMQPLHVESCVNLTVIGILNFLNGIYLPSIVCITVEKMCISIYLL